MLALTSPELQSRACGNEAAALLPSPTGWPRSRAVPRTRTVYLDLETGGVRPEHPIIQIAAVAIDNATWQEVDAIEMKLGFDPSQADPEALRLNHYDTAVWHAEAVIPSQARLQFARFLERHKTIQLISKRTGNPYRVAQLAGHNAASFDGPRLQKFFRDAGAFLPADPRVLDTLQRALWWFQERRLRPADYRLNTLCAYFGIPIRPEGAHEALADVRLTVELARHLGETTSQEAAASVMPAGAL
jgi:DNA polymerase III epsilon subunit-like protein